MRQVIAQGETMTTEFKSDQPQINNKLLITAAVCLANGRGGLLLVGVEDDGRITGSHPRQGDATIPTHVEAMLANGTNPAIQTTVSVTEIDGKSVLVIDVEEAKVVIATNAGLYVRRAMQLDGKPQCVPFFAHEMLADRIDRGEVDYAAIPELRATMSDLDPMEFERFRRLAGRAANEGSLSTLSDQEILKALGLASTVGESMELRRGALLLFGRSASISKFIPTHEVAFQVLRGDAVEVNEFNRNPLFKAAEFLFDRIQSRNTQQEVQYGLLRVSIPLVPEIAAREAIANALVHRDYTRIGAVRVQFSDDSIEISSPGGFPRGITLQNFLDESQARSPLLAAAFARVGLVERMGRGIGRIFDSFLRIGRDAPDYSRSTDDRVCVVFPTSAADLAFVRFLLNHEETAGKKLRLADLQILQSLRDEPHAAIAEIAAVLHKAESETRTILSRMLEDGMIEQRGAGRTRRFTLTSNVYRALESPLAYVRVNRFDEIQHEQMVLTYVGAHGDISRRQAGDLCGLDASGAGVLLRRMRDSGALTLVGEKRGARYILGS